MKVYIDGLNLYYGALEGSEYKWLDIRCLAQELFQGDDVGDICYFTAKMRTKRGDGGQRQRQDIYLRALSALPNVTVVYGTHKKRGKSWEEKQTDVNIATEMVFDAFLNRCTHAVLISNDTDLVSPVRRISDELGLRVTVVNPVLGQTTHNDLEAVATDVIEIETKHLIASQLPPRIQDASGRWVTKPVNW